MNKSLFLIPLIAIPLVLVIVSYQESEKYSESDFTGQEAILKIGEEFIQKASVQTSSNDVHILNSLREITEEELKESQVPDLSENEKIFNNGLRLSDDYNRVSFDYSNEKISDMEYLIKLFDFQIKYQKYMTAVDSYIGDKDILDLKNSMLMEYKKINEQIILLKNSGTVNDDWKSQSDFDKYKKFLPSMFES